MLPWLMVLLWTRLQLKKLRRFSGKASTLGEEDAAKLEYPLTRPRRNAVHNLVSNRLRVECHPSGPVGLLLT